MLIFNFQFTWHITLTGMSFIICFTVYNLILYFYYYTVSLDTVKEVGISEPSLITHLGDGDGDGCHGFAPHLAHSLFSAFSRPQRNSCASPASGNSEQSKTTSAPFHTVYERK